MVLSIVTQVANYVISKSILPKNEVYLPIKGIYVQGREAEEFSSEMRLPKTISFIRFFKNQLIKVIPYFFILKENFSLIRLNLSYGYLFF